jgi:hypothetical protein
LFKTPGKVVDLSSERDAFGLRPDNNQLKRGRADCLGRVMAYFVGNIFHQTGIVARHDNLRDRIKAIGLGFWITAIVSMMKTPAARQKGFEWRWLSLIATPLCNVWIVGSIRDWWSG